ncbi:hypothetical protein NL526_28325, partial [Klebsiella pneumoniae]|nr:hypothetical protein [Klebsiella pneumoniae]
ITEGVGIIGTGDLAPTIDGVSAYRIFDSTTNFQLQNLNLVNGHATGDGGAVRAGGPLYLYSVNVTGNSATGSGGAISVQGSSAVITN